MQKKIDRSRYRKLSIFSSDDLISKSIIEYGEWAQNEIEILVKFINSGDTVLDVGAYIGKHTIAFSNKTGKNGKVIAFEPNPIAFKILEKNCKINLCENVILYPYAIDSIKEEAPLDKLINENDVANSNANPLLYYLLYGIKENRIIKGGLYTSVE